MSEFCCIPFLLQGGDEPADLGVQSSNHRSVLAMFLVREDVLIGVNVLLRGLVGGVRRKRREVQEHRLRLVVFFDQSHRLVTDLFSIIPLLAEKGSVSLPVDHPAARSLVK